MVSIIVAISENNAIGKNNELLFKIKKDLQNFKEITTNNVVIMGRKTYESIGKPLPNRINVILSRNVSNILDYNGNIIIFDNLKDAIDEMKILYPEKSIFIIGGGQVYKQAIEEKLVDKLIITKVKKYIEDADTFFPDIDYRNDWNITDVDRFFENGLEFFIYQAIKR